MGADIGSTVIVEVLTGELVIVGHRWRRRFLRSGGRNQIVREGSESRRTDGIVEIVEVFGIAIEVFGVVRMKSGSRS